MAVPVWCGVKRTLVLQEDNLIFGILFVPHADKVGTGLADVLTVDDLAAEQTGRVQPVGKGGVGTEGDGEGAFQTDVGREGAQPFDLDGAAGRAEVDDLVAHFLGDQVYRAFDERCSALYSTEKFRLLDGVALLDAGMISVDSFDTRCHCLVSFLIEYFFIQPLGGSQWCTHSYPLGD